MTSAQSSASPWRVESTDHTPLAVWGGTGEGPPLLLVHGAVSDHRRWRIPPLLEPHRTVYAMDRRGRGGSGDGPQWSVDQEVEDVVAVVEAVAEATGSAVDVLGHSFGGMLSVRAAARTDRVRRLVLYEPAVDEPGQPAELLARMEELLQQGRPDEVVELMLREVVKMPEEEIATVTALPSWPTRVEAAHTVPRELSVPLGWRPEEAAAVTVPTLMIIGGDSPADVQAASRRLAEALPDSTVVVIEGQQHVADQLVPEAFAGHVLDFLTAE